MAVFSKPMPKQPVTLPKPKMVSNQMKGGSTKAPAPMAMKSVKRGCTSCGR